MLRYAAAVVADMSTHAQTGSPDMHRREVLVLKDFNRQAHGHSIAD
jgi:hypothetical protein